MYETFQKGINKMKTFIILLFLLTGTFTMAQEFNKKIFDEKSKKEILVGFCTREAFADTAFAEWYNLEYDFHRLDTLTLDEIKKLDTLDYNISIVFATWCSDTRMHLPPFFKILDFLNFDKNRLKLIGVARDKIVPEGLEFYDIQFVPTFLFLKENEIIGKIVEAPSVSLEKDFLSILQELKTKTQSK